ncbi:hypothetical protein SK128_014668, partial [Halocaridina rubra]
MASNKAPMTEKATKAPTAEKTSKAPADEHKDQLEEVLKSLKSIISSCGGECQAESLQNDYKELTGAPVPYRRYNHATLGSFLQGYPEVFVCSNKGGKLFVRLKDDKASSHISKLAQQQKQSSRKTKVSAKPGRRPGPSSWTPAQGMRHIRRGIDQNWREPLKSMPVIGHPAPRQRNFNNTKSLASGKPTVFPPRSGAPPRRPTKSPPLTKSKLPPSNKPKSPPLNNNLKQQPPHSATFKVSATNVVKTPSPGISDPTPLISSRPPLLPTPSTPPLYPLPVNPLPKVNLSALYYNDGNFNFPRAIRDNQEKQYAPYFEVPPRFKRCDSQPAAKTYKQKLEEELKKRDYKQDIVFRSLPCGKKKQHWVSLVY